jgi:hypothetical protein
MIVILKYFYETSTTYDEYNTLWDENRNRMVFLHHNLPLSKQKNLIMNDITVNKDILSVRFPTYRTIKQNEIINNILSGNGFTYSDTVWFPKEVWIYSPQSTL